MIKFQFIILGFFSGLLSKYGQNIGNHGFLLKGMYAIVSKIVRLYYTILS
jgi:hypothetical protein